MRYLKLANPHVLHAMSPAGMEPAGAERHGRSPAVVRFWEKPNQSNVRAELSLSWPTPWPHRAMSPAGMEPAGAERHARSPVGVSFREKASQSNLRFALPLSWPTFWHIASCPRRESNPHLRFRKPPFYPLNYEDGAISDFRSRIADFK